MEIANQWSGAGGKVEGVRQAMETDAGQITKMLREAPYTHVHADWHSPSRWLGSPSFVVLERGSSPAQPEANRYGGFVRPTPLLACLAAAADPPPAAWVRMAVVQEPSRAREHLAALFSALVPHLRESGVSLVGWLMVEDWPSEWLADLGLEVANAVATYVRFGSPLPSFTAPTDLTLRPVRTADLPALEQIEALAFEPLWRHSVAGLAVAARETISFDVAELDGRVVGFQFSTATRRGAHLSRMTIDPAYQRRGVGSALLAHALAGYERQGLNTVTLNTQTDNFASQRLYERFGFYPNGERFPVWTVAL